MTDIDQETQKIVPKKSWEQVRLEYLNTNLEAQVKKGDIQTVSLKFLAAKYDLKYGSLRNIAAEQDWTGQLALMIREQRDAVKDRIVHINMQSEVEVRTRQVHYGRLAQDIAVESLLAMDPTTLTAKEAIELLRVGTELERKAAGMEDEYIPPKTDLRDTQTREAVRQTMTALEIFRSRLRLKHDVPNPA